MVIIAAGWILNIQEYSGHDEDTANHSGCQGSESNHPKGTIQHSSTHSHSDAKVPKAIILNKVNNVVQWI
jgi:hypothetical protein